MGNYVYIYICKELGYVNIEHLRHALASAMLFCLTRLALLNCLKFIDFPKLRKLLNIRRISKIHNM